MTRIKEESVVGVIDFAEKNYGGKHFVSPNELVIYRVDRFNDAGCDRCNDAYGSPSDWHPDQAEGHAAIFDSDRERGEKREYAHAFIVNLSDLASYRPATKTEIRLFNEVEREKRGKNGCDCCLAHRARVRMARERKRKRR